ncbi:MAG: peroxiredoxin [Vulcanimicrobiaceae bacterium]
MTLLAAGDPAPVFSLMDAAGREFDLAAARGKPLVVFFYPRDSTPGCTAEACSFRDAYEAFAAAGATVVGISSDDAQSHAGFAGKHRLPFRLLSDYGGAVRDAFGIPKTWGLLPGRATFVIDGDGVIRHVFNSQFQPAAHAARALEVVRGLPSPA